MTGVPAIPSGAAFAFDIRGLAPRGPLGERLLSGAPLTPAAGVPSVLLIDGQSAEPDVVRKVIAGGLDRPLLLLHAGPAIRSVLGMSITFVGESDAYLVLPSRRDEPLRAVDFSRAMSEPIRYTSQSPCSDDDATFITREVRPGEIPPPEPFPPIDVPDRFANPHVETDAIADAIRRQIESYLRGEPAPRPQAQQEPPAGVFPHRYETLTKELTVNHVDAYYKTKYVGEQSGKISVNYFLTGYRNLDTNGSVQSDILVVELSAGAVPAVNGDLLTQKEVKDHKFNPKRYLGWFQESITVGLNYQRTDDLVLLGTTPNTVNRLVTEKSTKGFSIDIGFKVSPEGAQPTFGLNFKNEVSTETVFSDWEVGEQTSLFKPNINRNAQFVETVRWQYAVAHPYNGVVDGALLRRTPDVAAFTPQSTSGFNFRAATALEIPLGSPASRAGKLTLDAVLGWNLKYYYNGTGAFASAEFLGAHWLPVEQSSIQIDLSEIAKAGERNA